LRACALGSRAVRPMAFLPDVRLVASWAVLERDAYQTADPLTAEELVFFRGHLEERRARLLDEAGRTAHDMGDNAAEGFPDPADRGSLESERNLELRIRDRERKLITKIDEAIERIETGSFGFCEECADPIGAERLRVRPMTTLCIRCKEEQERLEKSVGR